jgi:hypothetical protein
MGGINLEDLSQKSVGEHFQHWEKVTAAIAEKQMPPPKMPQPSEAQRTEAITWIKARLDEYAQKHKGDPGQVTVRRLTGGEYAYAIEDLTGLDNKFNSDSGSDAVGGEGFANYGDVQFMQDANLERYLESAKKIANHAVIGSGPLTFFEHGGQSGFELSAANRIQEIYKANGFRTVAGEGARPFGLDRYGKAFYAAWKFHNRAALGQPKLTMEQIAKEEGISARFANYIYKLANDPAATYPISDVGARWRNLPKASTPASREAARKGSEDLQKWLAGWIRTFFAAEPMTSITGDDRVYLLTEDTVKASPKDKLRFLMRGRGFGPPPTAAAAGANAAASPAAIPVGPANPAANPAANPDVTGGRRGPSAAPTPLTLHLIVTDVNPSAKSAAPEVTFSNASVRPIRRDVNPTNVAMGAGGRQQLPPAEPLLPMLSEEAKKHLGLGANGDPEAFTMKVGEKKSFQITMPAGVFGMSVEFDVALPEGAPSDVVLRATVSDRPELGTGRTQFVLLGYPNDPGYSTWKAGLMDFAARLPQNSHGEPNPSDRDPILPVYNNSYNNPERDLFHIKTKYYRNDKFLYDNILDDSSRKRLDQSWHDLLASFDYHTTVLRFVESKYKVDVKGKTIEQLDESDIAALPAEPQKHVRALRAEYDLVMKAQRDARPGHVEDALKFAERAWRRPLTQVEKDRLRGFYTKLRTGPETDHTTAVRALLSRILVSPAFLYRLEPTKAAVAEVERPLSNWEMASRLSFVLWSSIPDDELRRAATAGELTTTAGLQKQVKRMLADPKARRFSTEFFGQWLGFYQFDEYRGVDTGRFPEFTAEVKEAMYDEAVSFFEHIVRKDRPVREMLTANYTFLNKPLAKHYGVKKEIKSTDEMELVEGANEFNRGGMLRLGAVLTATSAPLRTSPVKRGDWVLRRVLNTPTPPPPPNAGSIPADEKAFGGQTLFERLESHKRNPACASCHTRIDPLGFPFERFDAVGRWRDTYNDGKPVHDKAALANGTPINGIDGLVEYLKTREPQVLKTFTQKLLGYSLGRTVLASDLPLVEKLTTAGGDATVAQMVTEIVTSKQFRYRKETSDKPAAPTAPAHQTAATPAAPKASNNNTKSEGGL